MATQHQQRHIIIVGGGYSGISLIQSIREYESKKLSSTANANPSVPLYITLISNEDFCSRPNLFFRFKFLQASPSSKLLDYHGGIHLHDSSNSDSNTTDLSKNFIQKYNINQVILNSVVTSVNANEKTIKYKRNDGDDKEIELKYDDLCLCLGGRAHVVEYPVTFSLPEERSVTFPKLEFENISKKYHIHTGVPNYIYVRNVEEVELVYNIMRQLYSYYTTTNTQSSEHNRIVVIGSGTLSLDIVSHIIEGYEAIEKQLQTTTTSSTSQPSFWDVTQPSLLPKITIISRSQHIGKSLLKDDRACEMLTNLVKQKYSKYIEIELNSEIESIHADSTSTEEKKGMATSVAIVSKSRTDNEQHTKRIIPCSCIIQAVGVKSETDLAEKHLNAYIGANGGITVNEHFQVMTLHENVLTTVPNVYSIGDCAEIPLSELIDVSTHGNSSRAVWKNWTSAREQAILCSHYLVDQNSGGIEDTQHQYGMKTKLFFSQTPKFFGLFISCLGHYEISTENSTDLSTFATYYSPQPLLDNNNIYMKLVFKKSKKQVEPNHEQQLKLIGALLIGPTMNEYKLGVHFLQLLKEDVYLPQSLVESKQILQNMSFNMNMWNRLLQLVRSKSHGSSHHTVPFETKEEIEKVLTELNQLGSTAASNATVKKPSSITPGAKKFVNPLEKKKAAAAATQQVSPSSNSTTKDQTEDSLSKQMDELTLSHTKKEVQE
ncbi:hypothetical protein C9374_009161 [Naegleria lovaniensis]|uniref:FAD/NAD(P)-binding domain-containing protein n=1 Tax=Naegleria lovaniensis TaxID=51637 RepID=A0AA88GIY5_NAELO|nr:uncharacterized protein C9374_009161 [Naegleria lovaniensis]KAG2377645.1 hypothetical protein C9374_009161 [Naegleria lovaniensis]